MRKILYDREADGGGGGSTTNLPSDEGSSSGNGSGKSFGEVLSSLTPALSELFKTVGSIWGKTPSGTNTGGGNNYNNNPAPSQQKDYTVVIIVVIIAGLLAGTWALSYFSKKKNKSA